VGNKKLVLQVVSGMVFNRFLDLEIESFPHEAPFTLDGNANSHTDRYWCSENLRAVHEVLCVALKLESGVQ
jgi:hypothetical protein